MANWIPDMPKEPDIDKRCEFYVDGVKHTGEIVRCGNTRTWGHAISDLDGQRYEWCINEEGFRVL
jgi:hypothetical protein